MVPGAYIIYSALENQSLRRMIIKVYQGYGHTHDLIIYGHVFQRAPAARYRYSNNIGENSLQLLRLFFVKPFPHVRLKLQWGNQQLFTVADEEGFFKFEWESDFEVMAGWHPVTVEGLDAIKKKGETFNQMVEEMHSGYSKEPVVAGNHFCVPMGIDVTMKGMGRQKLDELAIYEVKDGKIVKEQFFF